MNPLDELERLHREATSGAWIAKPLTSGEAVFDEEGQLILGIGAYGLRTGRANMKVAAASRNIVPQMIALARAAFVLNQDVVGYKDCPLCGNFRSHEPWCDVALLNTALDALLQAIESEVAR